MSQSIITVGGDKRLSLSNGQGVRRPVYLDNWTTIRIGLRLCFPSAGGLTGTPRLWLGMCHGTVNGVADGTTDNFIGMVTNIPTWSRSAGPPAYFPDVFLRAMKRVGTTNTYQGGGDMSSVPHFSADDSIRNALILEITKGSPNYTLFAGFPSAAGGVQHDVTDTEFLNIMELNDLGDIGTVVSNYAKSSSNSTIATSEGAGVFDTINIFWDKTAASCEISDVFHRKVA